MVQTDHIWSIVMPRIPHDNQRVKSVPRVHGRILTSSLRRDLADLNRQYLDLVLEGAMPGDPLFSWSETVRREVGAADAGVRARMAMCPFALFAVDLPDSECVRAVDVNLVEDRVSVAGHAESASRRRSFARAALFAVWRLADTAPLAARIAFGLAPAAELQLNELCPTEVARLATVPGVLRSRWPTQAWFWAMLRRAAEANCERSLQFVHCAGICLMDGSYAAATAADASRPVGPTRR